MPHRTLAQHYFLDALDLRHRFQVHWEDQPRKSSRVKSFVDLLMACECLLKAKCLLAMKNLPLIDAYLEVKGLGHSINKLADVANAAFPSKAHSRAREHFGKFGVGLRYSVDAHEYFFPMGKPQKSGRHSYSETLGNATWINSATATVDELIEWGANQFNGYVDDDISTILRVEAEIEAAINLRSKPKA